MNLVEEITHNFKMQELKDREIAANKKKDVAAAAERDLVVVAQKKGELAAAAERDLDDKARHFSRLQLAKLHSTPPAEKNALIEEMFAENKRRLTQPSV